MDYDPEGGAINVRFLQVHRRIITVLPFKAMNALTRPFCLG